MPTVVGADDAGRDGAGPMASDPTQRLVGPIAVRSTPGSGARVAALLAAHPAVGALVEVRPGDPLTGMAGVLDLGLLAAADTDTGSRRARTLGGTRALLAAAQAAGVPIFVTVTSAMVLGTDPSGAGRGDAAPVALAPEDSLLGDLVDVEHLLAAAGLRGGCAISVLRPTVLCGAGSDGLLGRHFEGPRLLAVRGGRPRWQFCHAEDLVEAAVLALRGQVSGGLAVSSPGSLSQEEVEAATGLRRLEMPAAVAAATADRLHRLRLSATSASEIDFLTTPWLVTTDGLTAAGWAARYGNAAALRAQLELHARERAGAHGAGRSVAGASAAVALVGSAAVLRAARRRRR